MLWGVNLAGGEFNPSGTRIHWDYTYPTHAEVDYYASKGMEVIRLPFLWERVQSSQFGALKSSEIAIITDIVRYAASKGLQVDLDVHNYGSGFGNLIGTSGTPDAAFADLWGKLAAHFKNDGNVIFGLMNEPHVQSAVQWLGSANAAIEAIRAAGATQTILVPGSYWDGAWTWISSDNDTVIGNGIRDSLNNVAFEVHQYLDQWSSGSSTQVVSENVGVERLTAITQWAEANGHQLFLGEFGAGSDQVSLNALDKMLAYMAQHEEAWLGATIWGGGPWWGNYMFSVEPTGLGSSAVTDKPQLTLLSQYAAQDTDGLAGAMMVANVNAPIFTSLGGATSGSLTVAENTMAVTTVTAADRDGTIPTYAIAGGADSAKFTINTANGALSFLSAPDYEAPTDADHNNTYNVVVRATDGSRYSDQTLTVSVTNVNDVAPKITSNGGGASATIAVHENTAEVTTVTAVDGDGTYPTYGISGGTDAFAFQIDPNTGLLRFKTPKDFEAPSDVDHDNVYNVVVTATEGASVSSQALAISVTNVEETSLSTSASIYAAANEVRWVTVACGFDGEGWRAEGVYHANDYLVAA